MVEPKMPDVFTLERMIFTDKSTIGEIRFDGDIVCYSLELSCRKVGVHGKMAIPAGRYKVTLGSSPESALEKKFGYPLPLLNDVPDRSGIRIHVANWPDQLEGCIAPGLKTAPDAVYDSIKAFQIVVYEIKKRLMAGDLYLSILGGNHLKEGDHA